MKRFITAELTNAEIFHLRGDVSSFERAQGGEENASFNHCARESTLHTCVTRTLT